ncbi:MAG: hypothetical protein FWG12_06630 [Holophagaceae bacterium]|nr:hypothetical protein [Holophagaceae bacterium]
MKYLVLIMLIVAAVPARGQERTNGAIDPADIRNFLIQSQIVEYRPSSLRDPFKVATDRSTQAKGEMLIDEITIVGRVVVNKKSFVVVLDNERNAKQLPVGHRFLDGEITAITDSTVVFSQWDPELGSQSGRRPVTKVFKNENL